jgi:hypothetical protein
MILKFQRGETEIGQFSPSVTIWSSAAAAAAKVRTSIKVGPQLASYWHNLSLTNSCGGDC